MLSPFAIVPYSVTTDSPPRLNALFIRAVSGATAGFAGG